VVPTPPVYGRAPARGAGDSPFTRGFGTGFGFALGVGVVMVALSLISVFSMIGLTATAAAAQGTEGSAAAPLATIWGKPTAKHTMRAVYVTGPILGSSSDGIALTGGTYGFEVADMIDKLGKDDAGGLVLIMNTPGGTIYGSKAIADAVTRYQKRTGHKVVAYVEAMSASGGMYAMAGADHIISDYGTLVGSIGVIMGPFERYKNVTALDGGLLAGGVQAGSITSEYLTQGKGKDFGNPHRDMTPEERKVYTDGMAREYQQFVDHVAAGRKISAATIRDDLGASMFDPATAKEKKLVDDVTGRDAAFRKAAELNGLNPDDTRLEAKSAPSFLQVLLGAEKRVYGSAPAAQPIGGQPARATATICTGAPVTLAWHGDLGRVCG
jgi:protease-4